MARYFFDLIGIDTDDIGADYQSTRDARNAAVVYLGEYLRDYPGYASHGHWQADVLDDRRELLFSVVVTTVDADDVRAFGARPE